MPTYEFRCTAGHTFDKFFRSIGSAPSEVACPQCGEPAARQISGGAGLLFKGSGFYLTDYGKNAHRGGPAPKSGGGESKPADSKSDAGSSSSGGSSSGGDSGGSSGSSGSSSPSGGGGSSSGSSGGSGSSGSAGSSGSGKE